MTSISVLREALASELAFCSSAVQKRATNEILKYILLEVQDGMLKMRATDLELTAFASVRALKDVPIEGGSLTVELAPLLDYVRKTSDEVISLSADAGYVTLTSGGSKLKLPTLPVEDFPLDPRDAVEDDKEELIATLPIESLIWLFKTTSYAIGTDQVRYDLSGALLSAKDGALECVAIDGHRVARASVSADVKSDRVTLLGQRAIDAASKVAENGECRLLAAQNWTSVESGNRTLMSRARDVNFMNWRDVLAKSFAISADVDVAAWMGAVSRMMVAAEEGSRRIQVMLSKGKMTMNAAALSRTANEVIVADYSGDDYELHLNGSYLLQTLQVIGVGRVSVSIDTATGCPIKIEPVGADSRDEEQIHLIVPMSSGS